MQTKIVTVHGDLRISLSCYVMRTILNLTKNHV